MFYFVYSFSYVLSRSSYKMMIFLSNFLTIVFFSLLGVRKKILSSNIKQVFDRKSKQEINGLAFKVFQSFCLTVLELLSSRDGKLGEKCTIVSGAEILEREQSRGKGVYVLTIHMGNWEALGPGLSNLGYKSYAIVKKIGSHKVNEYIRKLRKKNGLECIYRNKKGDALFSLRKALRQGGLVGIMIDQYYPGAPFLPLFGKLARTNTTLASIWKVLPAPIVPILITRTNDGSHEIIVKEPLIFRVTEDKIKDQLYNTRLLNKTAEEMIISCPDQYFWLHNRWKI